MVWLTDCTDSTTAERKSNKKQHVITSLLTKVVIICCFLFDFLSAVVLSVQSVSHTTPLILDILSSLIMQPCMTVKQLNWIENGSYNASISVQVPIFHLVLAFMGSDKRGFEVRIYCTCFFTCNHSMTVTSVYSGILASYPRTQYLFWECGFLISNQKN